MNNVINLEVYRDNKPDATYARQERLRSLTSDFKLLGGYVAHYAKGVAQNAREDVGLMIFDGWHRTNLYDRKYETLERQAIARKAGSIGLLE